MIKYAVTCAILATFATALPQYQQQQSRDASAQILRQSFENLPDGSYSYSYNSDNGIDVQENGQQVQSSEGGTQAQGSYSFTAPDGTPVNIQYTADENGFQPQGDAIPTPPPIPAAIQRALEWIAAHPQPEDAQGSNVQPSFARRPQQPAFQLQAANRRFF